MPRWRHLIEVCGERAAVLAGLGDALAALGKVLLAELLDLVDGLG